MLQFIFTSLNLILHSFDTYLHASEHTLLGSKSFPGALSVAYGHNQDTEPFTSHVLRSGGVQIICGGSSDPPEGLPVDILSDYITQEARMCHWHMHQPLYSCVLFDEPMQQLYMFGDSVGSVPLWYAFNTSSEASGVEFVVSSDLLALSYLGFTDITAVGPGVTMCMNSSNYVIQALNHWSDHIDSYDQGSSALQPLHETILSATVNSLEHVDSGVNELDMMDAASILLECALVANESSVLPSSNRLRYRTPPLSVDYIYNPELIDRHTYALIEQLDYRRTEPLAFTPSYMRIAVNRARLCEGIYSRSKGAAGVLISHDTGFLEPRPFHVFFQNFFCSRRAVTVKYPLRHVSWRTLAMNLPHTTSYLNQVAEELIALQSCGYKMPFDRAREIRFASEVLSPFEVVTAPSPTITTEYGFKERLVRIARKHATTPIQPRGREIFLLLVTSDYAEVFANFICHLQSLDGVENKQMFIVITPNDDIALLAQSAGLGVARFDDIDRDIFFPHAANRLESLANVNGSDFGMVMYQMLVFYRTHAAMVLLEQGYNVIIADIDTVWIRNPLLSIPLNITADVYVTKDGEELCGCFVYLNSTSMGIRFWAEVLTRHRDVVSKNVGGNSTGHMENMFDSEQVILTDLLLRMKYKEELTVYILPSTAFPSGYDYFVRQTHLAYSEQVFPISIIHNNFNVGVSMKKYRFQRHGLWRVKSGWMIADGLTDACVSEPTLGTWRQLLYVEVERVDIPSLVVLLPRHNEIVNTDRVKCVVSWEGGQNLSASRGGNIWLARFPTIQYIPFESGFHAMELTVSGKSFLHLTFTLDGTNIATSVDVGMNNGVFALDRNGKWHDIAQSNAVAIGQSTVDGPLCNNTDGLKSSAVHSTSSFPSVISHSRSRDRDTCISVVRHSNSYRFTLRVLAYNRPHALERLLSSLLRADYGDGNIVDLYIYIDKNDNDSTESKKRLRDDVLLIATKVVWPFGEKRVINRQTHLGLKGQWYMAGYDSSSGRNGQVWQTLSIILEDDMQVSPYFFLWTLNAVERYYTVEQQKIHRDLLAHTRLHMTQNRTRQYENSPLDEFAREYAGRGVMYGVCLSKQHLDTVHYPQDLEVRNSHSPFLYSLIGTWGTLIYPLVWQAFLEWWTWKDNYIQAASSDYVPPYVGGLITDKYFYDNPSIWSPWMIRFAFETGGKFLYPNLPGNLSLATNFRDKGDNYGVSLGPGTVTLHTEHVCSCSGIIEYDFKVGNLWKFDTLEILSKWQYDLNMRRLGIPSGHPESIYSSGLGHSISAQSLLKKNIEWMGVAVRHNISSSSQVDLSGALWAAVTSTIESVADSEAVLLHIEPSALIYHSIKHFSYNHYMLSSACSAWTNAISDIDILLGVKSPSLVPCAAPGSIDTRDSSDMWRFLVNMHIDIVVLDLTGIGYYHTDMKSVWKQLSTTAYRYILVLGSCAGAPTDIELPLDGSSTELRDRQENAFTVIEDVCEEIDGDKGAILYQRVSSLSPDWKSVRHGVVRRSAGNIVARRVLRAEAR